MDYRTMTKEQIDLVAGAEIKVRDCFVLVIPKQERGEGNAVLISPTGYRTYERGLAEDEVGLAFKVALYSQMARDAAEELQALG